MKEETLREIGEKYGTPTFVFDTESLKKRIRNIKTILGSGISLCFSIKANPFLVEEIVQEVDKLEICSPGELEICQKLKVPGEKMVYSGVNKGNEDIRDAIKYGANIFTAESILQVELINKEAAKMGKTIPILLRLSSGSQFGMSKTDLMHVVEKRYEYPNIVIQGIHYFVGTQRKKICDQKNELMMLQELYGQIEKLGLNLEKLEYGPGLSFPYFEGDDFDNTLQPLAELANTLREVAGKIELTVEMGRFLTSECGYYISKVMDQKSNGDTNYCILDGGINHINYFGQMMGMKVPIIKHLKYNDEKDKKKWCLCGSLCTTADVIVRCKEFIGLGRNDLLVFCNIGAYSITEGIYLFLSRTLPRVVLIRGDSDIEMVRDFMKTSDINSKNDGGML